MWQIQSNTEITDFGFTPKGVALKTGPIKAAWSEAMSGFPKSRNGYDDYWEVATADATVMLNTMIEQYDIPHRRVKIKGEWSTWDIIVSTLSPEDLFHSCFGPLRWMGRDFLKIVLPVQEALPKHIYFLYYANDEPFTRIVEYKKFFEWDRELADHDDRHRGAVVPQQALSVSDGRRSGPGEEIPRPAAAGRLLDRADGNLPISRHRQYRRAVLRHIREDRQGAVEAPCGRRFALSTVAALSTTYEATLL